MSSSEDSPNRIRVVIVASVRLYREGLVATLGSYERLHVVSSATCCSEAKSHILPVRPDVVVIDVSMPGAFDLISDLRRDCPGVRSIAFAIDEDLSAIMGCSAAGATAYVSVNASIEEVVNSIERAAAGELLCTPRIAAELFRRLGEQVDRSGPDSSHALTTREQQVLGCVKRGLSNKEIAATLNISESTTKNHVHHVLEKLHVRSRTQAAGACAASGTSGRTSH